MPPLEFQAHGTIGELRCQSTNATLKFMGGTWGGQWDLLFSQHYSGHTPGSACARIISNTILQYASLFVLTVSYLPHVSPHLPLFSRRCPWLRWMDQAPRWQNPRLPCSVAVRCCTWTFRLASGSQILRDARVASKSPVKSCPTVRRYGLEPCKRNNLNMNKRNEHQSGWILLTAALSTSEPPFIYSWAGFEIK